MGGLISLTGYDVENPVKVGPGIADIFSGSLLSFGLLASILKLEILVGLNLLKLLCMTQL